MNATSSPVEQKVFFKNLNNGDTLTSPFVVEMGVVGMKINAKILRVNSEKKGKKKISIPDSKKSLFSVGLLSDENELLKIDGVGPSKLKKYGKSFLDIINK